MRCNPSRLRRRDGQIFFFGDVFDTSAISLNVKARMENAANARNRVFQSFRAGRGHHEDPVSGGSSSVFSKSWTLARRVCASSRITTCCAMPPARSAPSPAIREFDRCRIGSGVNFPLRRANFCGDFLARIAHTARLGRRPLMQFMALARMRRAVVLPASRTGKIYACATRSFLMALASVSRYLFLSGLDLEVCGRHLRCNYLIVMKESLARRDAPEKF